MEKKNQFVWFVYACVLCLCFSRTTAILTRMMSLPVQAYFALTAALVAVILLCVYLPVKLLAGRGKWNPAPLEKNGKMVSLDWILLGLVLAVLICGRLVYVPAADAAEVWSCYERAMYTTPSKGPSGLFLSDLYVWFLAAGMQFTSGTSFLFWSNLALQAAGVFLFYTGVKRMAGTICALCAALSVACLPPFFNSTFTAEPQSMLLFLFGVFFRVLAGLICDSSGSVRERAGYGKSLLTGIFCGISCFVSEYMIGLFVFYAAAVLQTGKRRKERCVSCLIFVLASLAGFGILLLTASLLYGQDMALADSLRLMAARWYELLAGHETEALLHSPTLWEYWISVPVYLLAFLAIFGASNPASGRNGIWIWPFVFFAAAEMFTGANLQEQGMRFVFAGIMSGKGILQMLHGDVKEAKEQSEQSAEEENDMEALAKEAAAEEKESPKEMQPAVRRLAPGEYLENPLPVPKRHVKKEMAYGFEPQPEQMFYEVPVADNDDFDLS